MAASFTGSFPQLVGSAPSIGFVQDEGDHTVVCTADGQSFLIEHTTSYFLLGFRPKDKGEVSLHKEGGMPALEDNSAVIAFTTIDGLVGLILIGRCLTRIKTLSSKTVIRHMCGEKCVWAGVQGVQEEPPATGDTIVETRKSGAHVWERAPKNPLHAVLDKVEVAKTPTKVALAPAPSAKAEEWSPGDPVVSTEAEDKKGDDDVVKTRRRQTPPAPRAPKKMAKMLKASA